MQPCYSSAWHRSFEGMYMISRTVAIGQDCSDPAGLHDEAAATRSELHHTKVSLSRSISETVAAADYLGAKCDRLENQTEERLTLIHSKLNKLSRTQVKQVSLFPSRMGGSSLFYFPIGPKDWEECMSFEIALWLNATNTFDKDEQTMRILSTLGSRSEENEKRTRIHDLKEEIVAQCRGMCDEMQEKFGGIQSSLGKRQQKTEQSLRLLQSRQTECTTSYARLASRIDQIDEERNTLAGDLWSIKDDVDGEFQLWVKGKNK